MKENSHPVRRRTSSERMLLVRVTHLAPSTPLALTGKVARSMTTMAMTPGRAPSSRVLRIGTLVLETPVLSAPVAGFTDGIYRDLVRELGGCGLLFTEMVSAGGWIGGSMPPARLYGVEHEARPLGVQLWTAIPT